jgi:acyl-coenzyme A synthetase/AMP-(fatty) acid ligase
MNDIFLIDDKKYTYQDLILFLNVDQIDESFSETVLGVFKFIKKLVPNKINSIEELVHRIQTSDENIDLYTSGTTSKPKKITHTIKTLSKNIKIKDDLTNVTWGLTYHPEKMASIQVILQAIYNYSTIVNLFGIPNKEIINRIKNLNVTHISATPTFYKLLMSSGDIFDSVNQITLGGEGSENSLIESIRKCFPNAKVKNIYASSEASALFASETNIFKIPKKIENLIKIVDGVLFLHRDLLGKDFSELNLTDNWYDTQDLVTMLPNNEFKFIGRKNLEINISGYKVNPIKIESIINGLPFIINNVVYSKKNSVTGNLLYCDIILKDKSITKATIKKTLSSLIEKHEIPSIINFVDTLKTNENNKISRI